MSDRASHFVELMPGGPADPDGRRTAEVLDAYFRAERYRAFRRRLWPRGALVAFVLLIVAVETPWLPRGAAATSIALVGALACWAAVLEWSADQQLTALIENRSPSPPRSSD